MNADTIIQSFVQHNGQQYFVSTANRASSSPLASEHRYAETIVWEWDPVKLERGRMEWSTGDFEGSMSEHFRVCQLIDVGGIQALTDAED